MANPAAQPAQAKAAAAIQANAARITPGPDGSVRLPDGVSLEQIAVSGRDLVIQLPSGEQIVIENGAVDIPQLVVGGVEIPAVNLAALLIGNEPQPAAGGPQSSGGNFARAVGDIGPGIGIGNLLPPTALEFSPPEFEEVYPAVDNDEPSVIIFPEDQPVGAPDVTQSTSDAGLPGGSQEETNAEQTTGTITFHAGDTPAHVTINGIEAFPGQIIPSEHGYLEIISVNNGDSADGFVEYVFVQTENVIHAPGSNDQFEEIFEVVVTDADGDTATGSLTITIMDDAPEANPDADSVAEHGPTVANGNVMTGAAGADANTTDGVADFEGADDAVQVTGVAAGSVSSASGSVGTTVNGQYGTLTISASGAYSYTLNPNHSAVNALDSGETLTDIFTYTITDADSDTSSTQLTITINGANDAPVANPDTHWVLDVATGSNPTATGNVLQTQAHPGDPSATLSFSDQADTDVDVENLTVTTTGTFTGTYGTLVLNSNGSYTYTLNASNAAVNALDDGETLTETFNYTASDGSLTASSTLTVTIFGANDAPVANPDTNWVLDTTGENPTTTGNVLLTQAHPGDPSATLSFSDQADTDVDVENLTVTTTGSFTGTYGTLVLNSDGTYTYTLNASNAAVNALDDGETLTDTFNYTASDGSLTASSTLTITIFGTNDGPVANPDTNWAQEDVAQTASGNVLQTQAHPGDPSAALSFADQADTDVDVENLTVTTTGSFTGAYGTLVLNSDGSYTYTVNNSHEAVSALDDGETLTDTFNYTASDGTTTASSTLTITIFGNNDAPVANPDTNWAQEDVAQTASGNVLLTQAHAGDPSAVLSFSDQADTDVDVENLTVTTTGTFTGTYGTLVLNSDGTYTYTVDNASVQHLDDLETVTDSFNYTASDGSLTASSTLTITIFGNNDAPVANPDTNWVLDVTAGDDPTTSGNVLLTQAHAGDPSAVLSFSDQADTDVDVENLTVTTTGSFTGTYGTLVLNSDGTYTYTLNASNAAVNALDDGETLTDSFNYTASDGSLTASSTLTITIFGTNDGPVANPDTNWAQEDVAQTASGNVLLTQAHAGDPSAVLSFADQADTDVDVENLTVTTTGSFTGTYGTLVLNSDGTYTYTVDNASVQHLDDLETVTDTFNYTASDGTTTASSTLTITIFGNNDAPVANPDTNWVLDTNNGDPTASGNVLLTQAHPGDPSATLSFSDQADTDVDVENLTVTTTGSFTGTYGTLVLNSDGTYTYTLDSGNATVNGLDNGETLTETFNYTASDGTTTASSTLTITIFGTNGAPVANPDTNWAQEDVAQTASGNLLLTQAHAGDPSPVLSFADQADTDIDLDNLTVTTTGTFTGTYGTLVVSSDGSYTYTVDNASVQGLDDLETVTDSFNYTVTDGDASASSTLTITIFGNNDAPVANPDTNWAQEDVAQTASGNVLLTQAHAGDPSAVLSFADQADTDVDVENLTVTTTGSFTGTYGTLVLNSDGTYTYTVDNASVQHLDDLETVTDTFNYTASDGTTTASSTLTITIFGNNDAPVANPDTNWVLDVTAGDNPTASGNVLLTQAHPGDPSAVLSFTDQADTDVDVENLTVTTTGSFTGAYGTLVLNSDGTYTYTLNASNAAVNALDDGETLTDSFNYTASDGTASASSTLTITIFGTNDGPVANPDTNWAQEDVAQTASGNVLLTQAHAGDPSAVLSFADQADTDVDVENLTVTTTGSFTGTYGTLVLNSDGTYTYTVDNASVQHLDDLETVTDSFNYTASDGTTTASSTLTITIFGNNDAPVANPDTNWAQEDVAQTASGNVLLTQAHAGDPSAVLSFSDQADTDVDVENLTVTTTGSFTGTYGTLVLNSDGTYTYTVDNASVQHLDDLETVTDTFNYTASDGTTTASSTLTVTIFGNNDAPVANPDTNWAQEDVAQTASGNVLLTQAHAGDPSAVLSFSDQADTDVDVENLTVTTTGSFTGTYGTLVLNSDGTYTYTVDNAAVQGLDDLETVTDSFNYTASDGSLTASSTLTITIFGNNDAPVANPDTNWVLDVTTGPNPTASGNVLLTQAHAGDPSAVLSFSDQADTDVDVENLTVTTTGSFTGTYGTLVLNSDGTYTYTLNASNAAVNALDDGETLTDTFNYTVTDGTATASSTVAITIFGTNDAPVVTPATVTISEEGIPGANADTTGSTDTTNLATNGGTLAVTDVDGETHTFTLGDPGAVLTVGGAAVTWTGVGTGTLIGSVGAVEVIRVTIDSAGVYSVQIKEGIDHALANVEDTDSDLVIPVTVSDGTTSTNSTITVTIEDDSPVVTSSGNITSMTGTSGSGTFAFNVGADQLAANDLTSYLTVSMTGSVGTVAISNVSVTADAAASTSTVAVYDVSFNYAPDPDAPGTTVPATGTLTFNGSTYTLTLDAPIESHSTSETADTLASTGYNLQGSAQQSEIVVSQLENNIWIQFMGDQETGGGNAVLFSSGGNTAYAPGELVTASQTYVTISGDSNGVAGDTIQSGEVLDMDFFEITGSETPPAGTPQTGDARIEEMFMEFDLYNGQDLVVILKLIDPDDSSITTRAIIVNADDVYTAGDTLPSSYSNIVLDNNDGLLVIESGDYNFGSENYVIYGAQVLSSTQALTGSGYDFNGDVGAHATGTTTPFSAATVDTDVLKITNIGFQTTTTTTETLHLDIAVTVTDGDSDSTTTTHLFVNPTTPVALDMDGDGLEFVGQSAGTLFDYNDDGVAEVTAWVAADDGVLAIDNGGDIDVVFSVAGSTDLEGLAATYDSNHDGVLSADDADFSRFGVLQNGEFTSLSDAGIASLDLVSDGVAYTAANNEVTVFGEGTFTRTDGSTGTLADAAFAYSAVKVSDEAQRVFGQNAGSAYANLLAAASMITAAATGFAAANAPLLKAIGVEDFLGDISPQQIETVVSRIETNQANIVDAFDGGAKEDLSVHDTVHFSDHLSNLLNDAGFEAPQANEVLSTLLNGTDLAPSLHDVTSMLVDPTVMPIIAAPLQAIAQNAPAAPELVAEVLADALSGGAQAGMSIDDLLSALPSAGDGANLLGGLSQEFGGGAMVLAAHPMAFHYEASLVLHQDSVTVA